MIDVTPREELILLAIYNPDNHPLYGKEIMTGLCVTSDGKKKIGAGTLYPVLDTLEGKGLVCWQWGKTQARRKYYTLTEQGKEVVQWVIEFRQKLTEWMPNATTERVG